jgi:formate dehydrogenase gamma subunit
MQRFTRAERYTHRTIALLMFILIGTAAALYIPDISAVVGNREVVKTIHSYSGFLLPIPIVLALFSLAFRRDSKELNRFHSHDWDWLRRKHTKPESIPAGSTREFGKFNAGQKINSAFTLGAILIMFGTGLMMFFSSLFTDDFRTGATFVHDWLALAIVIAVTAHTYKAFSDTTARLGMRTGNVPYSWVQKQHPEWALAITQPEVHPANENQRENQDESQRNPDPTQG